MFASPPPPVMSCKLETASECLPDRDGTRLDRSHWGVAIKIGPAISCRWPSRTRVFRKRCTTDPDFRATLADNHEAREAPERWRATDPVSSRRIADYVVLVQELEAEIDKS